jgi:hypothetical protein
MLWNGRVTGELRRPTESFIPNADFIGRAALDGDPNSVTNLITQASFPNGVTVDGGHVYWANDLFSNAIG